MSSAAQRLEPLTTLEALTRLPASELAATYSRGAVPQLTALSGAPHGRMLAIDRVRGPARRLVRRIAAHTRFPWRGKAFSHLRVDRGQGINRIRLAGERRWVPFETSIAPSVLDGEPCLLLDYDCGDNPWFLRAIRDELREVSPGLYLGPAFVRVGDRHHRME